VTELDGGASNPPRNGEGDHAEPKAKDGGGVDSGGIRPSVSAVALPPPRSGEELKRVKHRTVGASDRDIGFARKLRRTMTLPEVILWQQLRRRPGGFRFRRQFPSLGYVLDFACLERRVAVEVDGEVHSMGDVPERDAIRDARLAQAGFETLRIAARDVLDNLEGVLTLILHHCENRPPHHPAAGPPPRSGEEL
jgi:very-short-patch-repair endonuclease